MKKSRSLMECEPSSTKDMPPYLKFNLPDTEPSYGYSTQYILWLKFPKNTSCRHPH